MKDGVAVGLLLILSLFAPPVGLPAVLVYLLLATRARRINTNDVTVLALLALKISWLIVIYLLYETTPLYSLAQIVSIDLILLVTLLLREQEGFFKGLSYPLFALFLIDALFNIWAIVFGSDPLGRTATERPDDFTPRLGGVFFHPFFSINISIMTTLFALYLKKRWLFALSILNVVFNGSYRGILTLAVFFVAYVLIRKRMRFSFLVLSSVAVVASVVAVTYVSIFLFDGPSGNYFRVVAWLSAIDGIMQSPVTGNHAFSTGELPAVSEENIVDYGIAESLYLGYALHFGVVPAILHFAILYIAFRRSIREYYFPTAASTERFKFVAAVFACMAFIDAFYGTLIGSLLTGVCFGLFVFTGHNMRESSRNRKNLSSEVSVSE